MNPPTRNIKLLIEYDGTNYVGWQRQAQGKSIQGEIECVLNQIIHEKVNVVAAGRTDAGVHAHGQVAHFHTDAKLNSEEIKGGLNALLPDDVVVLGVEEVPLEFHARYSARERQYSYLITRVPTAMLRRYSWYVKYPLDVDLMSRCAARVVGAHDFQSFCRAVADVEHYQCTVRDAKWEVDGSLLRFVISSDRFLHGMVRALVGTMVDVGRGHRTFEEYLTIFEKRDRSAAGMTAPARGLVLEKVVY